MTVHAIEFLCSREENPAATPITPDSPSGDIGAVARERVNQNVLPVLTERLPGHSFPAYTVDTSMPDIPTHVRGRYRFATADRTVLSLRDTVKSGVVGDAQWYEIRYHECQNDAAGAPPACPPWQVVETYGTIPSGVP